MGLGFWVERGANGLGFWGFGTECLRFQHLDPESPRPLYSRIFLELD